MGTHGIHPPIQQRSQATLERICRTATELLEQRNWPEITVAQIVRRAGSSVGSFYARFDDKDALLDHLDERYTLDVLTLVAALTDRVRREQPDLAEFVHILVHELVVFHRRSRGLIRALVLRARMYREPAYDERTERMNQAVGSMLALLLDRLPASPTAGRRCALAFSFMFSALRDRILFPESIALPAGLTDEELADELANAMLTQLKR